EAWTYVSPEQRLENDRQRKAWESEELYDFRLRSSQDDSVEPFSQPMSSSLARSGSLIAGRDYMTSSAMQEEGGASEISIFGAAGPAADGAWSSARERTSTEIAALFSRDEQKEKAVTLCVDFVVRHFRAFSSRKELDDALLKKMRMMAYTDIWMKARWSDRLPAATSPVFDNGQNQNTATEEEQHYRGGAGIIVRHEPAAAEVQRTDETYGPLRTWDVSEVRDLSYLFSQQELLVPDANGGVEMYTPESGHMTRARFDFRFKSLYVSGLARAAPDISGWLVSGVTDMS
ncbi:unnamed protein product, partial [Amoebophrya sp. A25]